MRTLLLCMLSFCLVHCDSISTPPTSGKDDPSIAVVLKALEAYNRYDKDAYFAFFDKDISVIASHGLGQTRTISGFQDFELKYRHIFMEKRNQITVLNTMKIAPWMFVHQKVKLKSKSVEAVVGYIVHDGKIKTLMIMGEK